MTLQKPDSTGRCINNSSVRSAVEVDCSTWAADTNAVPRTTGRFVKPSLVRPAVEVDCSLWPETPTGPAEVVAKDADVVYSRPAPQQELAENPAPASLFVSEAVNGLLVIHSTQRRLDRLEGEQLVEVVREGGAKTILLNFSGVEFVSNAFVGSLVNLHKQVASAGGRLAVCNLDRQVHEVFSLFDLDRVLSICATQQEALQME